MIHPVGVLEALLCLNIAVLTAVNVYMSIRLPAWLKEPLANFLRPFKTPVTSLCSCFCWGFKRIFAFFYGEEVASETPVEEDTSFDLIKYTSVSVDDAEPNDPAEDLDVENQKVYELVGIETFQKVKK